MKKRVNEQEEFILHESLRKLICNPKCRLSTIKRLIHTFELDINHIYSEALIFAINSGRLDVAKFLVEEGIDFTVRNNAPLHEAAINESPKFLKLLIDAGADVKGTDRAIIDASNYGYLANVKLLIEAGANVNAQNGKPLELAIKGGYIKIVEALLEAGAIVTSEAINAAVTSEENNILKLLLKAKKEVDYQIKPLLRLAAEKGDVELAKLLINKDVLHLLPFCYETTLLRAIDNDNTQFVEFLVNLNVYSNTIYSRALLRATRDGNIKIVALLVEKGADVNYNETETLIEASRWGYFKVAKILVDAGANVQANDNQAIILAAGGNHLNIARLLIKSGADVTAKYNQAIKKASARKYTKMVELLIKAGADYKKCEGSMLTDILLNGDEKIIKLILDKRKVQTES